MQKPWTEFRHIKQAIRDLLGALLNLVKRVIEDRFCKSNFN